jgi:hypothetical protein
MRRMTGAVLRFRPAIAAALLIAGSAAPAAAEPPLWLQVCLATQPAATCAPVNRPLIEDAMLQCRAAGDKTGCYEGYFTQRRESISAAPRPTILRGK